MVSVFMGYCRMCVNTVALHILILPTEHHRGTFLIQLHINIIKIIIISHQDPASVEMGPAYLHGLHGGVDLEDEDTRHGRQHTHDRRADRHLCQSINQSIN